MLPSMLIVSSMLDSYSNKGPSIDDVLFNENFSLAVRLEPKMATKSTFEALSSGTILGSKMCPDLRCMYISKVQVGLESTINMFNLARLKCAVLMQ